MDPIEIFELYGYVVDASLSSPELSVFTTEVRGYVVQTARDPNAIFATEIRCYAVQNGAPKVGVAINNTSTYVITSDVRDRGDTEVPPPNSAKYRDPGIALKYIDVYTIGPNPISGYMGVSKAKYRDPGIIHYRADMYTIDIP